MEPIRAPLRASLEGSFNLRAPLRLPLRGAKLQDFSGSPGRTRPRRWRARTVAAPWVVTRRSVTRGQGVSALGFRVQGL